MNYNDYKRIMIEKNRIENAVSLLHVENAKVINENMKRLKNYDEFDRTVLAFFGIDIVAFYDEFERKKDIEIMSALRFSWDREKTLSDLGECYLSKLEVLKKLVVPTEEFITEHYGKAFKI